MRKTAKKKSVKAYHCVVIVKVYWLPKNCQKNYKGIRTT